MGELACTNHICVTAFAVLFPAALLFFVWAVCTTFPNFVLIRILCVIDCPTCGGHEDLLAPMVLTVSKTASVVSNRQRRLADKALCMHYW